LNYRVVIYITQLYNIYRLQYTSKLMKPLRIMRISGMCRERA
jgi:hypothetical protein